MTTTPRRRGVTPAVIAEAFRYLADTARRIANVLDSGADLADRVEDARTTPPPTTGKALR